MKSAFDCFREAAKCEQMAKRALADTDRLFLLDAAFHWKKRGEEAAMVEASSLAEDIISASGVRGRD